MTTPYTPHQHRFVVGNRGLAGIDGTVSTAVGVALGRRDASRTLALLGDVTFLHDANGLVIGPDEPRPDLTLVVVNDDGGSIFATLEQGADPYAAAFERVFGTPHGVDLEALCGASGTAYTRVDSVAGLRTALADDRPGYAGGRGPGRPVPAARHGGGDHRPGRRAGTIEPMSTSTPSLTRSSLTLAAGTMASRLLGVVRQSLIVLAIGQGLVGNAFQTANNLPNVIYMLIAGGVLNSVLVPQIVKAMRLPDGGREYTDRIITLSTAGMLVVTAACTAAAGWFVFLYAGSLAPDDRALATFFAVLTMPQIFFYGLYAVLGQVLNARSQFAAFAWAPAVANVFAIAGLLAFMALYDGHTSPGQWTAPMVWLFAGQRDAQHRRAGAGARRRAVAHRVPVAAPVRDPRRRAPHDLQGGGLGVHRAAGLAAELPRRVPGHLARVQAAEHGLRRRHLRVRLGLLHLHGPARVRDPLDHHGDLPAALPCGPRRGHGAAPHRVPPRARLFPRCSPSPRRSPWSSSRSRS